MICMRCGAPATVTKRKRMTYRPGWVLILILFGLLPFLIVSLILEKRCRLVAPFCEQHRGHWSVRSLWLWGIFMTAFAIGVAGIAMVAALPAGRSGGDIFGVTCPLSLVILLGWLITAAVLHETSIHATEITDYGMTLACVSERFLNALYQQQRANPYARLEEQQYFGQGQRRDVPSGPGDQYYDPQA
jgi:hypothetical protein